MVASFQPELVLGVSTYAHELFSAVDGLDAVYVPIGLGSGICGVIAMRDLLGLKTKVIGVSSDAANGYAQSFRAGKPVGTESSATFADGIATRQPNPDAVAIINKGAERIVEVSDTEIADAIRLIFRATHNVAEGAGAAALAALMQEREAMQASASASSCPAATSTPTSSPPSSDGSGGVCRGREPGAERRRRSSRVPALSDCFRAFQEVRGRLCAGDPRARTVGRKAKDSCRITSISSWCARTHRTLRSRS
jgi:hypothetical protein